MSSLKAVLFADLYRINGSPTWANFARECILGEAYRYNVALRITAASAAKPGLRARATFFLGRLWLMRLRKTMGINLQWATAVGPGLFIGHTGGIVVSPYATVGRDCNLSHNVTIGVTRGGARPGAPTIGDRVYIGPGAVVIGAVTVGDDAAIGANSVVTKDVPAGSTARGNPAAVYPNRGSGDYVNRTSQNAFPIHS